MFGDRRAFDCLQERMQTFTLVVVLALMLTGRGSLGCKLAAVSLVDSYVRCVCVQERLSSV